MRTSNPLNFLRLFVNGRTLRSLAVVEALGALVDGRAISQVSQVQRQELRELLQQLNLPDGRTSARKSEADDN